MAADIPALRELDINPLLVDADGVLALDARVAVAPSRQLHRGRGHPRFAVLPYPKELERNITLADGRTAFVRPVRPEDDAMFRAFFARVSAVDLRLRFFRAVRSARHDFIARIEQLTYSRSRELVGLDGGTRRETGDARRLRTGKE